MRLDLGMLRMGVSVVVVVIGLVTRARLVATPCVLIAAVKGMLPMLATVFWLVRIAIAWACRLMVVVVSVLF